MLHSIFPLEPQRPCEARGAVSLLALEERGSEQAACPPGAHEQAWTGRVSCSTSPGWGKSADLKLKTFAERGQ